MISSVSSLLWLLFSCYYIVGGFTTTASCCFPHNHNMELEILKRYSQVNTFVDNLIKRHQQKGASCSREIYKRMLWTMLLPGSFYLMNLPDLDNGVSFDLKVLDILINPWYKLFKFQDERLIIPRHNNLATNHEEYLARVPLITKMTPKDLLSFQPLLQDKQLISTNDVFYVLSKGSVPIFSDRRRYFQLPRCMLAYTLRLLIFQYTAHKFRSLRRKKARHGDGDGEEMTTTQNNVDNDAMMQNSISSFVDNLQHILGLLMPGATFSIEYNDDFDHYKDKNLSSLTNINDGDSESTMIVYKRRGIYLKHPLTTIPSFSSTPVKGMTWGVKRISLNLEKLDQLPPPMTFAEFIQIQHFVFPRSINNPPFLFSYTPEEKRMIDTIITGCQRQSNDTSKDMPIITTKKPFSFLRDLMTNLSVQHLAMAYNFIQCVEMCLFLVARSGRNDDNSWNNQCALRYPHMSEPNQKINVQRVTYVTKGTLIAPLHTPLLLEDTVVLVTDWGFTLATISPCIILSYTRKELPHTTDWFDHMVNKDVLCPEVHEVTQTQSLQIRTPDALDVCSWSTQSLWFLECLCFTEPLKVIRTSIEGSNMKWT